MPGSFQTYEIHQRNEDVESFLKEEGTVFHSYDYLTTVGDDYICLVAEVGDEGIAAVLPLVKSRKRLLKAFHRPPYTYQFGPVVKKSLDPVESGKLIRQLLRHLPQAGHYDLKCFLPGGNALPFTESGFEISVHQTHIVDKNENYGLQHLSATKRRDVQQLLQLEEEGMISCIENEVTNLPLIEQLVEQTGKRANYAVKLPVLRKIFKKGFQNYQNVIMTKEGKPLSASYCLLDKYNAYHLISARKEHDDHILSNANVLSVYKSIRYANEHALNFDTEGSNIAGIAQFYRLMGAKPEQIYRAQKSPSLYYQVIRSLARVKKEVFR